MVSPEGWEGEATACRPSIAKRMTMMYAVFFMVNRFFIVYWAMAFPEKSAHPRNNKQNKCFFIMM